MTTDLFSASILLILVLDPFDNIPLVISALARVPRERHARLILRECVFAFLILLGFMAGGRTFMQWLQLSDVALSNSLRSKPARNRTTCAAGCNEASAAELMR